MRSFHRNRLVIAGLIAGLLVAVAGAARVYDHAHRDRLAPGIKIDGIDVGGMSAAAARERLTTLAAAPRRRPLRVHAGGRTFTLTPQQLRVTVDIDAALARAVADSRRGWLGSRVMGDLSGRRVDERLPIPTHYTPGVIPRLVRELAARTDRAPRDASVTPSAGGLLTTPSRPGRAVDAGTLKVALDRAARNPRRPATTEATTHTVAAKVSATDLARRYAAYLIVDRKAHVLRFYRHLKLADNYPIAVGRAGLETPAGLYDVQWKQTNPSWYVPNSPWAGKLAGKTIPPGPDDPIKARWLAFNGGAGIHGIDPSEYSSIGHDASHGCVRMRIPDVISLFAHTPVKSPVFVA